MVATGGGSGLLTIASRCLIVLVGNVQEDADKIQQEEDLQASAQTNQQRHWLLHVPADVAVVDDC